ncbi:MAG TPA: alcohol dehydrogenase catalytic domain-containing protein [Polyangiaceae bacterium]|nr:alcohol dehydrogenase catalytic domain-containing protein [Polyangiaceae bacterium]
MKAVYLTKPGRLETRDAPDPRLNQPTDVLLELSAVGICGSDLHYFRTGRIGSAVLDQPWIMGHECAAVVAEVGSGVTGLCVGDRVAVDPLIACGRCDQCRSGRKHTCREQHFLGCPGQQQGCLCQRIVMPSECCFKVPDQLSVGAAVMVEPFAIALHARRLLGSAQGKHIGILGAGPIGLCMLAALQLDGPASLAITDPLGYRLEMARRLGATSVHLLPAGPSEGAALVEEILGRCPAGLDAVFDCSGEQTALDQAASLLAPGGTLLIVGIPEISRVSFDINVLRRKELTLKNVRRQNDCTDLAVELLGSGRVQLDEVITHCFDLSESQAAFDLVANYRDGVAKALITF